MGASTSKTSPKRQHSDVTHRLSTISPKPPMPDDPEELERRFNRLLQDLDLPPDKARVVKGYEPERKWDMIIDLERVSAKEPPENYLSKLKLYVDPQLSKQTKDLKALTENSSTETLKALEISLRTNHIEWVRNFLSEQHNGLDVLVDYLSQTLEHIRYEQPELASTPGVDSSSMDSGLNSSVDRGSSRGGTLFSRGSARSSVIPNHKRLGTIDRFKRQSNVKINYGDAKDDVHICIMCLRAIMNHQNGFNLVFGHKQAINCIALSLNHRSFRTKTLVLELLAAICLVSGGHEMILSAFDNFKKVCGETHRFETLIRHFRNHEEFHIDFMVACMQFINIIVHSVQDMNFRVHLQHEFSILGLDDCLEKLRHTESDRLPIQVNAYLDNTIDVQILLEDSDTKNAALEKVAEFEDALSHANERAHEIEDAALTKIAELQGQLSETIDNKEKLQEICEQLQEQLRRYQEGKVPQGSTIGIESLIPKTPVTPSSPAPFLPIPSAPPPPPPPPFLPMTNGPPGFMPPPPPPMLPPGVSSVVSIKKSIQPKCRLPILNWIAMKPLEVKGTLFSEIDDEKLYKVLDFNNFEENFKIGNSAFQDSEVDGGGTVRKAVNKRPEKISLLESNRMRNVAITKRKIEMSDADLVKAINSLDLKTLSLECVEIVLRMMPNEQETKTFKEYEKEKKPVELLSEEDRFMISLLKVERLSTKLHIMSFIGNFFDTYHHLQPQLNAVLAASASIKSSSKIRQLFEIILAFGNYMNSYKRGAVYGFKLQSLDMLMEMKTNDKKSSLLHFIVKTVKEKFPDLANFEAGLNYIEKAATVSLENIITDIGEMEKGMDMTKKEYEARKDREPPVILKDFLNNSEDKLRKLKNDAKNAQEAYSTVVQYFGENPKTLAPNTFFSLFVRFVKAYKQAQLDLENMLKLEEVMLIRATTKNKRTSGKYSQAAVVNELKGKQKQMSNDKKVINRDQVSHGTLEDLISDIKSNPYRRADAMRRSVRRNGPEMNIKVAGACVC